MDTMNMKTTPQSGRRYCLSNGINLVTKSNCNVLPRDHVEEARMFMVARTKMIIGNRNGDSNGGRGADMMGPQKRRALSWDVRGVGEKIIKH